MYVWAKLVFDLANPWAFKSDQKCDTTYLLGTNSYTANVFVEFGGLAGLADFQTSASLGSSKPVEYCLYNPDQTFLDKDPETWDEEWTASKKAWVGIVIIVGVIMVCVFSTAW